MGLRHDGSRELPLKHLSIRVPWHDQGWDGSICRNPKTNAACLVLDRIRKIRKDDDEEAVAGQSLKDLDLKQWPPCVDERGTFMAPFEIIREISHPYSETNPKTHGHFLPTSFRTPPYSAAAIPFRWMLNEYAWEIADEYELGCNQANEPVLRFSTDWVQDYRNQTALLNTFFSAARQEQSLCFFYAKETPLSEDNRRVIIGVGRVLHVPDEPVEYSYSRKGRVRCVIWDRPIQHSIHPDYKDGFILPYHEILARAEKDRSLDPSEFVAFAPDRYPEFSYGTEHVTNDGAIEALLTCRSVLEKMKKVIPGKWEVQLEWIDDQLSKIWKLRGAFPGLGSVLRAFGVHHGNFLAYEISSRLDENGDPWPYIDKVFDDPSSLPEDLAQQLTPTLRKTWKSLPSGRRALLKLLSRFEITNDQAERFYIPAVRKEKRIECSDAELLANPYLLYELDRFCVDPIRVDTIDLGMFPDSVVRKAHPIPEPSVMKGPTDPRRVRALIVDTLEQAAAEDGHSLLPQDQVINTIRERPIKPKCSINEDILRVMENEFKPAIALAAMQDDCRAYQLKRLKQIGELIRDTVERKLKERRHSIHEDWRSLLDKKLEEEVTETKLDDEEGKARKEKTEALKELAEARISVLVGSAGTGKTTMLSVLCQHPEIKKRGVLLLAPTGKARVQLQVKTDLEAMTLAQFLLRHDRYDEKTGIYHLSTREKVDAGKTVIVDEASMLTEEHLGALLDALKGVERIILCGDPRQLPPIGVGRPFVDIVKRLTPSDVEALSPRVGPSYAELMIRRRQVGRVCEDLQLAEWFSGRPLGPGEDEVFNLPAQNHSQGRLRFVHWDSEEEIVEKILEILVEELELEGRTDITGFERKLGAISSGDYNYFNPSTADKSGAAEATEKWQILTPVHRRAYGDFEINRLVQKTFRKRMIELARKRFNPKIPKPMGPEEIVYGDKVINIHNHRRFNVYPKKGSLQYVANGEIGIVVGQFKSKNARFKGRPRFLHVEFSSQPTFKYNYSNSDFKQEQEPLLRLAYALTIHKAQGSEFDLCILILPNPCHRLSRELLYTALTRQRERLVILHQGPRAEFKKYSSDYYSETARRLTNLFWPPAPVPVEDRFLEERLIHRTRRGDLVRSKSEVIIADNLYAEGIKDYEYEQKLIGDDESVRYPDFTIESQDITYYWEHLGMLFDEEYKRRWQRKIEWYRQQKILPLEEGGGERGTLITTKDRPVMVEDSQRGSINSSEINDMIKKVFKKK